VTPRARPSRTLSTGTYRGRVATSRRVLLAAAGGVVAAGAVAAAGVEEGVLPGRTRLRQALGLDGPAGHIPEDVTPGHVVSGAFTSEARLGTRVGWSIVYPGSAPERLPVMVSLHGLGGDHTTAIWKLGMDRFLPAAVAAGVPRFAVATIDGGNTYYHPRPSGEDAGAMVVDEYLPLLERQGLDVSRLAFHGWSMGGYGALRLTGLLGASRVSAVSVLSAALWVDPADASTFGFADAAEYEQYSVMGHQADLDGVPVRLDCGTDDPFYAADRTYVAGFDHPIAHTFRPGAHNEAYWTRMLPAQLRFVGAGLSTD
jgi:predicted esterase